MGFATDTLCDSGAPAQQARRATGKEEAEKSATTARRGAILKVFHGLLGAAQRNMRGPYSPGIS
jgi:hypothetical protein